MNFFSRMHHRAAVALQPGERIIPSSSWGEGRVREESWHCCWRNSLLAFSRHPLTLTLSPGGRGDKNIRAFALAVLAVALSFASISRAQNLPNRPQFEERLSFQAIHEWEPRVNLNADVAMAYGIDESLPKRLASWKSHGYLPEVI